MTDAIKRLREPAALGAALFAALSVLAAVVELLFSNNSSFSAVAASQEGGLLSFPVALALAIAVYLANHAGPAVAKARLVTLICLITAGVAGLFGLVAFFAGLGAQLGSGSDKVAYFLGGAAGAIVLALAGWYTWLTWQASHAPVRPATPAGPGGGAPAGWSGLPGRDQASNPGQAQGQGGQGAAAQAAPGAGFGWAPGQANEQTAYLPPQPAGPTTLQAQQSATGSFSVAGGQNAERTQMMPPVPPTMQGYAPAAEPWQPSGPGGGSVPPPQTRPMPPEGPTEPDAPFGVGDWR